MTREGPSIGINLVVRLSRSIDPPSPMAGGTRKIKLNVSVGCSRKCIEKMLGVYFAQRVVNFII